MYLDLENVQDFPVVPEGLKALTIKHIEENPTKAGDGRVIKITFSIKDGDFSGTNIFMYYTVQHSNERTVNIAKVQIKKLCEAVGMPLSKNTDIKALVGKEVMGYVLIKPAEGKYSESNTIKSFQPLMDDSVPF